MSDETPDVALLFSDVWRQMEFEIERLRERLAEADEANRRVSDENEKLRREAAIRIDALEREQEAHLKTMADLAAAIRKSGE